MNTGTEETFKLPDVLRRGKNLDAEYERFSKRLFEFSDAIGFKMSGRGWGYFFEGMNLITKSEINRVEDRIKYMREKGYLPYDFVATEQGRRFVGVEVPTPELPVEHIVNYLRIAQDSQDYFTPDWWVGEDYYIQMVVEKIDLVGLFSPICAENHIPLASMSGWSSLSVRAEYAARFKEAEQRGLTCVLLYCGDFDCAGLKMSDTLREHLEKIKSGYFSDGRTGYDPRYLNIDRFGLNYDFIEDNNLVWVENLITGSGGNLADPRHKHHQHAYVQDYLKKYGVRKVEANALVADISKGRQLCSDAITEWLGADSAIRFERKREKVLDEFVRVKKKVNLNKSLMKLVKKLEKM